MTNHIHMFFILWLYGYIRQSHSQKYTLLGSYIFIHSLSSCDLPMPTQPPVSNTLTIDCTTHETTAHLPHSSTIKTTAIPFHSTTAKTTTLVHSPTTNNSDKYHVVWLKDKVCDQHLQDMGCTKYTLLSKYEQGSIHHPLDPKEIIYSILISRTLLLTSLKYSVLRIN